MSLTNAPDPEIRAAVVQQDLENVLHPIVQHKPLETKQIVVTGAHGSTIFDADGTAYLDAMAGLWCVNIGYGRTELAEVAAEQMQQLAYFPHTAMNVPAAALAEKINTLMGGGYHTYFVNSGSEANEAGFKIARQYQKHEHPGEFRFKTISRYYAYHGTTLATLDAGGMGDRKAKFEPLLGRLRARGAADPATAARSAPGGRWWTPMIRPMRKRFMRFKMPSRSSSPAARGSSRCRNGTRSVRKRFAMRSSCWGLRSPTQATPLTPRIRSTQSSGLSRLQRRGVAILGRMQFT